MNEAESAAALPGIVEHAEYLGSDIYLHVRCEGPGLLLLRAAEQDRALKAGDRIAVRFTEERLHFFTADERALAL